ncbi:MAG: hypothetical protein INQ03_03940 [Candidatus Heimdallarchaeota archaeon]|nr:hypothetical protein [Candidatus Heimdallarchaeota archaeon]
MPFIFQQPTREPTQLEYELHLRNNPGILTTGRESLDLLIAFVLLFLVFGFRPLLGGDQSIPSVILLTAIIAPAFILHEMAHKYAAIFFGKYARFALIKQMTIITLIVAGLGFGIAGPGATMVLGKSTERERGIFAAAGPATNFLLSLISIILIVLLPPFQILGFSLIFILKFSIFLNSFLALFNLIPVSMLDGKKVITWSKSVWLLLVVINLAMYMYAADINLQLL